MFILKPWINIYTLMRTGQIKYVVIFLVLCMVGCRHVDDTPEQNTQQLELNKNRTLWSEAAISNYQYTYRRSCFCPPQDDVVVLVTAGMVSEAFYTPSGTYLADDELTYIYTIEELFDTIQEAINTRVAYLQTTYNSELGYPEDIFIDRSSQIADEEMGYHILDFQ